MERYKTLKQLGDGTYGTVWKAVNMETNETVAVKKMKKRYYSWQECMDLREVKSLRKLNHPNIIKLLEVIRQDNHLFFVFEYMECNLYEAIQDAKMFFPESLIRSWCFQAFRALAYMHHHGYFHRDLKPENILVTNDLIKIADFGLAREVSSKPPYTDYVSTRWYRAPEVLLQSSYYDSAIDLWAMGAIIAELFTFQPLFPGSNEIDVLNRICRAVGTPNNKTWAHGLRLASSMKYHFPKFKPIDLLSSIPNASPEAVDLIRLLLSWDPAKRPTAVEVLYHPFFQSCLSPAWTKNVLLRPALSGKSDSDALQKKLEMVEVNAPLNSKPSESVFTRKTVQSLDFEQTIEEPIKQNEIHKKHVTVSSNKFHNEHSYCKSAGIGCAVSKEGKKDTLPLPVRQACNFSSSYRYQKVVDAQKNINNSKIFNNAYQENGDDVSIASLTISSDITKSCH